jgi:Response regulators consisting of a CheY-like receiver domain and a winged-helix DNA-binding domain
LQRIFIVEDDDSIRDMLLYALSSTEFEAFGFNDGEKFWEEVCQTTPTLILLDIMLPGEDGIAILKKLKRSSKYKGIPVIMLTAKGSEYDRISGLDMGADDYIAKPFSVLEVISRIRAVLRRCAPDRPEDVTISAGKIILYLDKRSVSSDGAFVTLTYKEFELLHYLMINDGIVMTRDKLLTQVWGFDYNGESRTVDMHIRSLRQKLGDSGEIIKTVRNVGYKIEG